LLLSFVFSSPARSRFWQTLWCTYSVRKREFGCTASPQIHSGAGGPKVRRYAVAVKERAKTEKKKGRET
jgi:hypothetical protein